MTQSFDDTELMAFADGVLEEPRFSEVAAAIEADPALAERLELIVAGGKAAEAVFAGLADLPVPDRLTARVDAAIAAREGKVVPFRRRARAWVPVLAAAAIAAIAVGPVAYLAGGVRDAPLVAIGTPLGPTLTAELARLPSGTEARLGSAVLRPIATFTDASATLCREFEVDGPLTTVAVACRSGAEWRVAIAIDAPPADDGYAPASSLAALDAFLGSIDAGPPLPPEAEAEALARP
jgi:hypothetical protein